MLALDDSERALASLPLDELVPKTQGMVSAVKEIGFALNLAKRGKVPPPFPPHVAKDVKEARALHDLVRTQGREGAAGIVQGEKALAMIEHVLEADPDHAGASRIDPQKSGGKSGGD